MQISPEWDLIIKIATVIVPALTTIGAAVWLSIRTERIKTELQEKLYQFQTKYSLLHQKRAEAIQEIYSLIFQVEQRNKSISLILNGKLDFLGHNINQNSLVNFIDESAKAYQKLYETFNQNRIILDVELCNIIDEMMEPMLEVGSGYFMTSFLKAGYLKNSDNIDKKFLSESCLISENKIPLLKRKLEAEFRKLLSPETKPETISLQNY